MSRFDESICHAVESDLSALIDGELQGVELQRSLGHLVDCAACREFYRRARTLDAVARGETEREGEARDPGEELWTRIAARSQFTGGESQRPESAGRPIPRVWAALAAVLMLALGMVLLNASDDAPQSSLEIVLGEQRGQMDEARFIALTTELLRADRRYQRKMLDVMLTVDERLDDLELSEDSEPSEEDRRPRKEDRSERDESSRV